MTLALTRTRNTNPVENTLAFARESEMTTQDRMSRKLSILRQGKRVAMPIRQRLPFIPQRGRRGHLR